MGPRSFFGGQFGNKAVINGEVFQVGEGAEKEPFFRTPLSQPLVIITGVKEGVLDNL